MLPGKTWSPSCTSTQIWRATAQSAGRSLRVQELPSGSGGRITNLSRTGRKIFVETESGEKEKYVVPLGKRIIVHQGDYVEASVDRYLFAGERY